MLSTPTPQNHSFVPLENCATVFSPARIAIVDPSRLKAELLLQCSNTSWGMDVVALEKSGKAGLAAVARTQPEIVLVSAHLADVSPWEFIRGLKNHVPKSKAVLLVQHCSEYLVDHLRPINYHGLICEADESMTTLGEVIHKVRNGFRVVSAAFTRFQVKSRTAPDSFVKLLTSRHVEVLTCITHSLSDGEIADQLGCSPHTALGHRQQIMRKLNIRSTPKLIRYGLEKGFGAAPLPEKRARKRMPWVKHP